jgi:hypothetical protein
MTATVSPRPAERHQRLCAWVGVSFMPAFLIGLLVAGWLPPPAPGMDAGAVAAMYAEDRTRIRIGVLILTAAAPLLAFFVAALSHQLRRIAPGSPLVTAQTIAGSCLLLEFLFPQLVWQTAAYRAPRSPEIVQTLNDLGWLPYIGIVGTAIAQMVIIAAVVLTDRSAEPLLPRWSAYLNLWTAAGVACGSLCVFVTDGPIAWNGIISFWLLAVSFFVFMTTMTVLMLRASRRVEAAPVRPEAAQPV